MDTPALPPSASDRVWGVDAIEHIKQVRGTSSEAAEWFFRQAIQARKLRVYRRLLGRRARDIPPIPPGFRPEHYFVLRADLLRLLKLPEPDTSQAATSACKEVSNQTGYVSDDTLRRLTKQVIDELKAENTLHTQPVVLARVNKLLEPKRVGRRRVNPIIADLGETLPRERPRNK